MQPAQELLRTAERHLLRKMSVVFVTKAKIQILVAPKGQDLVAKKTEFGLNEMSQSSAIRMIVISVSAVHRARIPGFQVGISNGGTGE